jgi:hypothetical protein
MEGKRERKRITSFSEAPVVGGEGSDLEARVKSARPNGPMVPKKRLKVDSRTRTQAVGDGGGLRGRGEERELL